MRFTIATAAQRSPAWFTARCGRLTGSRARAILAAVPHGEALTRAAYRRQLVAERYTGVPEADGFRSDAMVRGFAQEPAAIRAYEAATGAVVRRTGFLAHTTLESGCSVDGDVGDFAGILEVKNPNTATHVAYKLAGRLPLAHVPQVTHNLWLSGAAFCDFVSFDDRCGPRLRLFIVRVRAADLDLAGYERKAITFLAEVEKDLGALRRLLDARRAARTVALTHFVAWDQPGERTASALCGRFVDRTREHALLPTCGVCAAAQARYEAIDI